MFHIIIFLLLTPLYSTIDIYQTSPISASISGISKQCSADLKVWMESLAIFTKISEECVMKKKCSKIEMKLLEDNLFAFQEIDSFGRIPSPGMLEMRTVYDGSYQECQRVSGKKYDTNYCYLLLSPGKNSTLSNSNKGIASLVFFRLATCYPKSCGTNDLVKIFNTISLLPFTAQAAFCAEYDVPQDAAFWIFTSFMIVMISIAILATSVDYIRENVYQLTSDKEKNIFLKLLLAFSFWTNAGLLLSVAPQKPGFIKSLDCIRFLSMAWVVTGHMFIYMASSETALPLVDFPKKIWNHLIMNALVSVDTFFLLSGIVVAYLFFKEKPKRQMIMNPITWILFYVHRYLRLTPTMMIFIGFFTVYVPYVQGPFSAVSLNMMSGESDACKITWWKNLLYINNFYASNPNQCYAITWYLAADTQLYLVAPIILISLYFSFLIGLIVILGGCLASVGITYYLMITYDIQADLFGNGNANNYNITYDMPWVRCTPYFIGILTGYILATFGKRQVRLNWFIQIIGWLIALGLAAAALFATNDYDTGAKWSKFERGTYYNFSRIFWAIAVSWVVVANHMGWGGPINNFMSHPIWQPFGRLSYCAYIVHWMMLFFYLNIGSTPLHYVSAWQTVLYYVIPVTLLSYFFAFFWSCLFEVPVLKLEKMLIEGIMGRRKDVISDQDSDKKETTLWDEVETTSKV